jgi:hypothetical protein
MRTRAARRAAEETQHNPQEPDTAERVPLGDVSPNAHNNIAEAEPVHVTEMPPKRSKSRAGNKKGAKGKKSKAAATEEPTDSGEVREEERQAAASPASDATVEELAVRTENGIRLLFPICVCMNAS